MRDVARKAGFRVYVGTRIRAFRHEAGLTQMQLAFMSNLDRSFIQKIEHGRQSISFENMWKIASCLRRELSEFIPPINEDTQDK